MCSEQDALSLLKGCKRGYEVFHSKRLEPRVLPQHSRCHSVSFVM